MLINIHQLKHRWEAPAKAVISWNEKTDEVRSAPSGVRITGRVTTPDGRGIRNATATIVDRNGILRTVATSAFGYYTFDASRGSAKVKLR